MPPTEVCYRSDYLASSGGQHAAFPTFFMKRVAEIGFGRYNHGNKILFETVEPVNKGSVLLSYLHCKEEPVNTGSSLPFWLLPEKIA
jgi:hypothetical protein